MAAEEQLHAVTLIAQFRVTARLMVDELVTRLRADGFTDVTSAHHPVLENIDPDGTRLTTLAARAGMTHQSMSELVAGLERNGYLDAPGLMPTCARSSHPDSASTSTPKPRRTLLRPSRLDLNGRPQAPLSPAHRSLRTDEPFRIAADWTSGPPFRAPLLSDCERERFRGWASTRHARDAGQGQRGGPGRCFRRTVVGAAVRGAPAIRSGSAIAPAG